MQLGPNLICILQRNNRCKPRQARKTRQASGSGKARFNITSNFKQKVAYVWTSRFQASMTSKHTELQCLSSPLERCL